MRSLNLQDLESERLSNVSRALLLALISSLFVLFPSSGVVSANATPNPAALNFNDGTCDLTTAGYLGSGSAADPYMVSDSDALWEVTDCSMTASAAAHFLITNDIDVSQAADAPTTSPIGYSASGDISFGGVIDGGNKVISGISMAANSYGVGLFAYLDSATISNLVISGSFVTTTNATTEEHAAGALAIRAAGSLALSSISNQASVMGHRYIGGLVGYVNSVTIVNSYNTGAVSGIFYVGGLVGYVNNNANITSSYNTGAVSGSGRVGGLVGDVFANANIDSSHNTGTVSGTSNYVGGLVGFVGADANIDSSFNIGAVPGSTEVGGLLGYVSLNANITSSYNTGAVSGSSYVGGLVAYVASGSRVVDSTNSGRVETSTNAYTGGLIAYAVGDTVISASRNTGAIAGHSYVGGLVGRADSDASLQSTVNTAPVTAQGDYVAGLIGYLHSGEAIVSFSSNTASITGLNYVAGLLARVELDATIHASFNSGSITGSNQVGGLIGRAIKGVVVRTSQNSGTVTGAQYVGGLAGRVGLSSGTAEIISSSNIATISATGDNSGGLVGSANRGASITSSYNLGTVVGNVSVGGLIGAAANSAATIHGSYNAGSVTTGAFRDGLIGRATTATVLTSSAISSVNSRYVDSVSVSEMQQSTVFTGFDFTNSWGFGSCTDNQGFPMLRVFAEVSNYNSVACGYTPPAQSSPSPGSTPAPVPVLQPLPVIDQTKIQTAAGNQQLLTGQRFELIRSATINGLPATISQLTATSLVLSIPALASGNYSLDLETSNGRISFQGLVEIGGTSLGSAQLGSTFSVITGLNPRSSWLNKTAVAELEQIFTGQSAFTCIAYNDRPGLVARKKALSRAMHACRIAEQLGIETRVFVYGKAPELADTVKILFR